MSTSAEVFAGPTDQAWSDRAQSDQALDHLDRAAFVGLPVPALVVERETTEIVRANRAARLVLAIGGDNELDPPTLAQLVTSPLERLVDDLRIAAGGGELPLILVDRSDRPDRRSCRVASLGPPGGRAEHWLVTIDTTSGGAARLRSLGRRLQEADELAGRERVLRRQLAEDHETLKRFANAMAHDLKGPLRHIGALLPVIEDRLEADLSPDLRRLLRAVQTSAGRGRDLVDALLAHAGASSGPVSLRSVDLDRVVDELIEVHRHDLARVDDRIEVDRPLGSVWADPALVQLLLDNLLTNAVKYRRHDHPLVVRVGGGRDASTVIEVVDNGIGFEPTAGAQIFEPFTRLTADADGHGVGLATCRMVCRRHGWTIEADGRPGRGARFVVRRP